MAKTLTAAAVKNYRPGKARREIPDGGCSGLYLIIQASGHRSWAMRFRRPSGKPAKLTLGPVDLSGKEAESEPVPDSPLTLASARRLAAEIHRQRAMGRDVVADYDASRRRQKSERENSRPEHIRRRRARFHRALRQQEDPSMARDRATAWPCLSANWRRADPDQGRPVRALERQACRRYRRPRHPQRS